MGAFGAQVPPPSVRLNSRREARLDNFNISCIHSPVHSGLNLMSTLGLSLALCDKWPLPCPSLLQMCPPRLIA